MVDLALQKSYAEASAYQDGRLVAPAAQRNGGAILDALLPHLARVQMVLELASGTGEHAVKIAAHAHHITWQPTDIDPQRLASIAAWIAATGAKNVRPPQRYNAVEEPWPGAVPDIIFVANLVHLLTAKEVLAMLAHVSQTLAAGSKFVLYGPFKRHDGYASDADRVFDEAIRAEDPDAGYKSIEWMENALATHALQLIEKHDMPANNLFLVWSKSDDPV